MMGIESPLLCFLDVRQRPGFVEDRPSLLIALQLILSRKFYIATVETDSQTGDRMRFDESGAVVSLFLPFDAANR
jgi:hypothetical protein